jgi:radical SAM protein with 4Fe4S-binding SPASM domain
MDKKIGEYCKNPYLKSYGVETMAGKMTRRYGERYLEYRKRWAMAEDLHAPDFPLNLELDLIDACTLSCPQCLRSPDLLPEYKEFLGKGTKLEYAQIVKLLEEGQRCGLPSVNIGGSGECMLHPDFFRICRSIMDHDIIELRIISNGTRLTEEITEGLIDQQVHFLSISIDAASSQTYGQVRGKPEMYQKVVDNVNRFLTLRERRNSEFPMLRVTFVRQEKNNHELTSFIDLWASKADLVDIQTYSDFRTTDLKKGFCCNQPWKRLAIYADGHVVPCCGFPGIVFNLGNIHENSLQSIWASEQMRGLRQAIIENKYPSQCLKCMGVLASFDEE